ncbi:GDYXXLXY domain-containing protein [Seonamhaeicola aphaedonensis]|uniref:Putative membrane-anchored protein n=1 Tax=Seonamhaeicola aphaedonensis TaxID=1461338 RepID=A0A3D9HEP9_9FLAO|nr:GDYXXLXY domain-containing protein [Seonamhaeicola aphaedonensis]RED47925.1 putative membrane-anchored protein [Seonamhaeicola aphaedonensis]
MKSIYIFIIFLVVVTAQIFVPTQMILDREAVLNTGVPYKFKTRPIDPADPFRGKYIALRFKANKWSTIDSLWVRKEKVYVYLDTDSLGFAKIHSVSKEIQPEINKDFIEAKVDWYKEYNNELHVTYPFNRFYMEEGKAYDAEVVVRENQKNIENVYALVFVKNGESVLKDVIIDNMPLKDYVGKEPKQE